MIVIFVAPKSKMSSRVATTNALSRRGLFPGFSHGRCEGWKRLAKIHRYEENAIAKP